MLTHSLGALCLVWSLEVGTESCLAQTCCEPVLLGSSVCLERIHQWKSYQLAPVEEPDEPKDGNAPSSTFRHLQAEPGRPSAQIGCAASFLWKAILLKTSYWGVGNVVLKGVSAVLPLWIRISLRVCELLKNLQWNKG